MWQKGDVRDMQDSQSWLVTLTILARQFDCLTRRNRLFWGVKQLVLTSRTVPEGLQEALF